MSPLIWLVVASVLGLPSWVIRLQHQLEAFVRGAKAIINLIVDVNGGK